MNRILLIVGLLVIPQLALAGEFRNLADGVIAMTRLKSSITPTPSPSPTPSSDKCDNCGGVGKVGDGRTMITCPVCDGTGKAQKVNDEPVTLYPNYPLRSKWWSGCSGWQHLTTGQHAGKFDTDWLKGLSHQEIQSLHSDDHEGKVKWDSVVRGTSSTAKAKQSDCPGGNCPTGRQRRFGRLLF